MQGQRQGMKVSYLGSEAEEVSDVLARCIGPVRVQKPPRADLSYRYEFVAAGRVAFSRVSSLGSLSIGQKDEVPKLLLLLPLHGSACVKIGRGVGLISKPGQAAILDGNRLSELQVEGERNHLSLIIDQGDIVRRLGDLLERPVYGSLDFIPELDLAADAGQIIFGLSQIMNSRASRMRKPRPLFTAIISETMTTMKAAPSLIGVSRSSSFRSPAIGPKRTSHIR